MKLLFDFSFSVIFFFPPLTDRAISKASFTRSTPRLCRIYLSSNGPLYVREGLYEAKGGMFLQFANMKISEVFDGKGREVA